MQQVKTTWILFSLLCLWVGIWQIDECRLVEIQLPSKKILIPKKDKQRLEYFCRELIVYNCIGYTLFGNKPVSFDCVMKPAFKWDFSFLWHTLNPTMNPTMLKKYCAWKTWQKYRHFFCGEDFLMWSEPCPWIENGVCNSVS
jgi:hypothetical protein